MGFDNISPGKNVPDNVNVIIEIPAQSNPVKYEVDKASGALFVDRFMATSMHYPCNYGYIPHTLCEDGDPIDVLVVTPFPLLSGSVISARPIGMLKMTDESGPDSKILALPDARLTSAFSKIEDYNDMPESLLHSISHFFEHYKDLEPNKWVKVDGWEGIDSAKKEILASVKRYQ